MDDCGARPTPTDRTIMFCLNRYTAEPARTTALVTAGLPVSFQIPFSDSPEPELHTLHMMGDNSNILMRVSRKA